MMPHSVTIFGDTVRHCGACRMGHKVVVDLIPHALSHCLDFQLEFPVQSVLVIS